MINIVQVIEKLLSLHIFVYVENGKLKTRSKEGVITAEIGKLIRDNRDGLLEYLTQGAELASVKHQSILARHQKTAPLSFAQQRLWLLDQIDGGSAHYNMPGALQLSGVLDVEAINQAFCHILERHESLRTCFSQSEDGLALQVIQDVTSIRVPITDLSHIEQAEQQLQITQLMAEEAGHAFDLRCDLMLRASLLKLGTEQHILLVTMHHIASDGWSMAILINEFSSLYSAYIKGQKGQQSSLPPLAIQYADYAHWQRNWLQGEVLDQQLNYWDTQLAGLPVVHSLPLDHPRPMLQSFSGATIRSRLSIEISASLRSFCQTAGATLFMGLHAAFSVLLSRYSNERDIVVGSPISNREQAEVAPLIGFFANTLILRCDLSKDPSFTTLLEQSKRILQGAYAHQQVPFEQIVERLQPQRSMSHSALFQIMLVLQNNEEATLDLPGLTLSGIEQKSSLAKFDLTLNVTDTEHGMDLEWEYNTDLFEANTITAMSHHFDRLLSELLKSSERNVFSLNMQTAAERQQLLIAWNDTNASFPEDKCIHELFEEQVKLHPDAVALIFENEELSYRELNQKSNQLAHYLIQEKDVKPDSLVGICIGRSFHMVIAILAVLKSGAAYVPLDPDYPAARLAYMLDDAKLDTVITLSKIKSRTPISAEQGLCLDDLTVQVHLSAMSEIDIAPATLELKSHHLAYVIYTSGSTGHPKGVTIEHRNTVAFLFWVQSVYTSTQLHRVLAATSICFDLSIFEMFAPLSVGGASVILLNILELQRDDARNISLINTVPSAAEALLSGEKIPSSVRTINLAGEPLKQRIVDSLYGIGIDAVYDLYGPSEDTTYSTYVLRQANGTSSIGKPIANTQVYVLNHQGQAAPLGIAGELHIAGAGLARGYLHRADLTAEKFIANPFFNQENVRSSKCMYRTGDLVRWMASGNLEYLGRIDHQVKIRGFRIEIGEIENALRLHAKVADVVVLANTSATGEQRLVAYVVTNALSDDEPNPDEAWVKSITELRAHLSITLPEYMLPAFFVFLNTFPMTPNGKIDRRALPEPEQSQLPSAYFAPRTETEQVLCKLWQDILGIVRVGLSDNFFQLGGHSLSATRLVARINQTYKVVLPLKTLFSTQNLEQLAQVIYQLAGERNPVNCPPLVAIKRDGVILASYAQQRLWLLDQIDGGSAHYNLPGALELSGVLHYEALNQAFIQIVKRHESLRTCFAAGLDGQVVQVIKTDTFLPIAVIDLSHLMSNQQQVQMNRFVTEETNKVFRLSEGPMLRARLLKLGHNEHILLVTMHHIASDGWSMAIFINELGALYESNVQGVACQLPVLDIQYADYAHWQRQWLQAEVLDKQLNYWTTQLANLPLVHSLPLDYPRPQMQGFSGANITSCIDAKLSQRLRDICQASNATLFMGLHAVFSVLLSRYSNEKDIVVGSPIANREQAELAPLIGLFVNTLVLRSNLSDNPSFAILLEQSKHTLLDAYSHQQVPFEQIVEVLQPQRSLSHSTLFQIMLVLQNNDIGRLDLPELSISPVEMPSTLAKYELMLSVIESEQGLELTWIYNVDLFESATIGRMAKHFEQLFSSLLDAPQESVFKANLLSDAEREQLLIDWNNTTTAYPNELCLHELFEQYVENNPDALALVFEDQQLSYGELNEKANRLAHYLVAQKKLLPDSLVGLCMERSLDLVVGILGIMKAGCAYVPLDPEYPAARLAYMLTDAKLDTVITHTTVLSHSQINPAYAICFDSTEVKQQMAMQACSNLPTSSLNLSPKNLAYVIYTSGSTGKPKGVMVEHHSLVNLAFNLKELGVVSPGQQWGWMASYAFDGSVKGLTQLMLGCPLSIISEACRHDPTQLAHVLDTLTVIDCTPMMVEAWFASGLAQHLPNLIIGGEAISDAQWDVLTKWQSNQHKKAYNVYGPTECTVDTTACLIAGPTSHIGKILGNTKAYVVDENFNLVGCGIPGELHIGGVGLARGYFNQAAMTADRFIVNPFHDQSDTSSNARLYKTGDLVRYLPNGCLDYLGRTDHQVKIRGYRIELGEIESSLSSHRQIKDAVVVAKEATQGDNRLAAYIVLTPDYGRDEEDPGVEHGLSLIDELRQHLSQTLPDFMLPSAFVFLDTLPLTHNGKVDRKGLPEPDFAQLQKPYRAPGTQIEQILCTLWQEILDLERVGIEDDFFQLGGHSLLATRLVARINQMLDVSLPLKMVFVTPILKTLAQVVAQLESNNEQPRLTRISRAQPLLPSYAQQRLWLLDQIGSGSAQYNMPGALKLTGMINFVAMNYAISCIIERHESLRTNFVSANEGQVFQRIEMARPVVVPLTDLSHLLSGEQHMQVLELMTDEAASGFDLGNDLMLRAKLIKLKADEHIFLVTMHHIASDGWSMAILINEFSTIYSAYVQGHAHSLPMLDIQYADYAHWQRLYLQGDTFNRQLEYWCTQLADLPVVHSLPLDHPRPQMQSYSGETVVSHIDSNTTQTLKALCQQSGATLFMGLHAAFAVLLARYSNEADIVIGSAIANREQAEVAPLIGFFVNTLVLRSDLSNSPSFAAMVDQSKRMLLDAYAHQQVPFEQIVERLQPQRSLSHSALFQIMLVLQNNAEANLTMPGLTLSPVEQANTVAKFDLTLNVNEDQLGLSLAWTFNTDLFEVESMTRMAAHFEHLLTGLVHKPQENVFNINMLGAAERHQLLTKWNDTAVAYPSEKCIHELFEQQAQEHPSVVALVCQGEQLNYQELNQKANQLAHFLISQRGVKPDSLVGLCVERSLDMIIGILGILKAGAAYVPIDPNCPDQRLAYMLEDAKLTTVITHGLVRTNSNISDELALCLDAPEVNLQLSRQAISNIATKSIALTARNLAYVIYTSGSTGGAKGVMVEHQSAVNFWNVMRASTHRVFPPNAKVALNASFTFDMSLKGILQLLSGHCLVLIPQEIRADGSAMLQFLREQEIDTFDCTPSQLEVLLSAGLLDSADYHPKRVLIGGEALSIAMWDKLRTSQQTDFFNMYGPTECTVDATICLIREAGKLPTIGRPIANMAIYILDSAMQPVPVGVAGEIYIGGVGVARGYLERPALSAERFMQDPFNTTANARMYRTGDLARWTENGYITYLGRNDFQVKIRGFRIELGEIEARLNGYVGVRDAVVIARQDGQGQQRLVAYLTEQENTEIEIANLRTWLNESLAEYMIPSAFVVLNHIPLNANGKVDRKSLPEPDFNQHQTTYLAPRTSTEQILCGLWQDILGVERVGIADNFFQLGGHSLLVMQVISRLQKLGITLTARQLFSSPNVAELGAAIDSSSDSFVPVFVAPVNLIPAGCTHISPDMLPLISMSANEIEHIVAQIPGGVQNLQDIYPLGPLQEGILFHHMMSPKADPYVMPRLLRITGEQEIASFLDSLQFIVDRHDVLRTAVLWRGLSAPVQVVSRQVKLMVEWIEISAQQDCLSYMQGLCAPEIQQMDLGASSSLKLKVARDGTSDQYYVFMQLHHIVSDHIGLEIIERELTLYYTGQSHLLPKPVPYREFVAHTLHQAKSNDAQAYFTSTLGDIDEPTTPFNLHDVQGNGSQIVETRAIISADTNAQLRQVAKQLMISPATVFHVAWAIVVATCSRRKDVVFGTVVSGRLQGMLGAENMLGVFINTLPLRVKLNNLSVVDLMQQVHNSLLGILPYEQASLALAQRCTKLAGDVPLFSAMLNFRHTGPVDVADVTANDDAGENMLLAQGNLEYLSAQERTNYPLFLSVDDLGDSFSLHLQVEGSLNAERIAAYMQTAVRELVKALMTSPSQKATDISILPDAEKKQLLLEWSDGPTNNSFKQCMHELFEEQLEKNPDAVAVIFEDQQLTFIQLNEQANQLAHFLTQEKLVKPDSLVGICIERSLHLIIGILAILKAGAAYIPLDPDAPTERLRYMLDDAGLTTVLTQESVLARTPIISTQALCLDANKVQEQLRMHATSNTRTLSLGLQPHHLAYVIYTSGSTGHPKAVMQTHQTIVNLVQGLAINDGIDQPLLTLQFASPSFDVSVQELATAWHTGGTLLLISETTKQDLVNLPELLRDKAVERVFLPPAVLHWLVDTLDERKASLPALREIFAAGEALVTSETLRSFLDLHPQCTLWNHYGPTETHVATRYKVKSSDLRIPIGTPISGMQVYVLNADLVASPLGVSGELLVGGAGLARNYLARPELTAEKFIANPFYDKSNPHSSERLYKTGDLVRWMEDGNLDYLGRLDDQVKIRGFRIELGEIETALLAHPKVKEAVVLAKNSMTGDKRLVAYVVAGLSGIDQQANDPSAEDLSQSWRDHLSQTLPDYMIPAAFVMLELLPLTTNGKVDRKALPEPDQMHLQTHHLEPRTYTEQQLCILWQGLLGIEHIGVEDNFFQLGGHSLLAVRLVSAIEKQFGVRLPMSQLFSAPSVAALAVSITANAVSDQLAVPMQTKGNLPPLFLIHPGGGGVFCYSALVAELGDARPIYGIQDADEAGLVIEPYDMDTIAARYTSTIISLQKEGPYHLAGWSLGGMLAFKIANILEQQGRKVQFVILLDTVYPRKTSHEKQTLAEFIFDLLDGSDEDLSMRYEDDRMALIRRIKSLVAQVGTAGFADMLIQRPDYLESTLDFDKAVQTFLLQKYDSMDRNTRLLIGFSAEKLSAPVHRIWAEYTAQLGRDLNAWDGLISNKENSSQHLVPGMHGNFVMGESMPEIAQLMKQYLEPSLSGHQLNMENQE